MNQKSNNVARLFTDGACSGNPGIGGWAAVLLTDDKVLTTAGYKEDTTNNRMELRAVISGLVHAKKHNIKIVHVYSDSAYVVNAITKGWLLKWRASMWKKANGEVVKNADLWHRLYSIIISKSFDNIEFFKVKGHSGNHFNEMADSLAREQIKIGKNNM